MPPRAIAALLLCVTFGSQAAGDDLLFVWEGDILASDPASGWQAGNPCDGPCSESLENGHYVLRWAYPGGRAGFFRFFPDGAVLPDYETFWAEWRFRADQPYPPNLFNCELYVSVRSYWDGWYAGESVEIWGNRAISFEGSDSIGFTLNEFHTFRYEIYESRTFAIAVDGEMFNVDVGSEVPVPFATAVSFSDAGACVDGNRTARKEYDYFRVGTIARGERILAADPPPGELVAGCVAAVRSFTVTFDAPNYVHVNEITVQSTGSPLPQVMATRRQDNGPPETLEIVLDRPLPVNATTTLIFNDGALVQQLSYTVVSSGDTDADGVPDPCDNCVDVPNPAQANADADSLGDPCDNCVDVANEDQADTDSDGVGDACDNCVDVPNPGQANADGDSLGDPCDPCVNSNPDDSDADGVCDSADQCPGEDDRLDDNADSIPDCLQTPIPTVSAWGALILTLGILIAAKRYQS